MQDTKQIEAAVLSALYERRTWVEETALKQMADKRLETPLIVPAFDACMASLVEHGHAERMGVRPVQFRWTVAGLIYMQKKLPIP